MIFIALHLSKKGPGRPSEARIPGPITYLASLRAAAAWQRLDALDLFARLLIEGQGRRSERERKVETMVSRVLGRASKEVYVKATKRPTPGAPTIIVSNIRTLKKGHENQETFLPREGPPRVQPHDVQLWGRPRNRCGVGQSISLRYSPPSRS